MRISDNLAEKYHGKFAVKHAGIIVIPERDRGRKPFNTQNEAMAWAKRNYRGTDWEIIQLAKHRDAEER